MVKKYIISAAITICPLTVVTGAHSVTTSPLSGAALKVNPSTSDIVLGTDTTTGQTRNFPLGKLPASDSVSSALANKADKSTAVQDWSAWAEGSVFVANMLVAYQGQIYKCTQPYTKHSGETPAVMTAYWSATGGSGVSSYNDLTDKPSIPATLAALTGDSTHRVVTDAKIGEWDAKQSALTAGTDYLSPTGSAANLTNFPSSLATDAEVATAVSGKANASSLASQAAFLTAYGWLPTGTFDTAADATITGDWSFSSGLEASNISLNLGSLADLKIGNAQMVDDTKGNGDTNYLWSADKVFDQLATKQSTLVSGTTIKTINGNSLLGSGDLTISGGSGTSGYVSLSAAPYSDVACTTGQYGYYESTAYLCTNGFWTSKWALTTHTNATPVSQCSQTPSYDQSLTGGDTGWYLGGYSVGALYTGSNSYTICSLGFNINSIVGNINSQTYSVNIYTRSGNNLGTLLATKQITGSLITTGWNNITLDSTISTGTSGFAIVITGPMDGTNYPTISTMSSNGDSSWSTHRWSGATDNLTIDNDMALRIYQ